MLSGPLKLLQPRLCLAPGQPHQARMWLPEQPCTKHMPLEAECPSDTRGSDFLLGGIFVFQASQKYYFPVLPNSEPYFTAWFEDMEMEGREGGGERAAVVASPTTSSMIGEVNVTSRATSCHLCFYFHLYSPLLIHVVGDYRPR